VTRLNPEVVKTNTRHCFKFYQRKKFLWPTYNSNRRLSGQKCVQNFATFMESRYN